MNVIEDFEQREQARLHALRDDPQAEVHFAPGDTVRVLLRVIEGQRTRLQAFEGACIARQGGGLKSTFTLRKISYGEGVERVFPLYSPRIAAIEVLRRGRVRRAKLTYMRGRRGRAARIREKRMPRPEKTTKTQKQASE